MTRKVVFFTTGMTAGGAERVVATLANALDSRGFEVVIAMVKGEESAYDLPPGVRLRSANLNPGLRNLPAAIQFYRQLLREESPDVVASFSTKSDIIALIFRLLFRSESQLIVSDRADPYTRNRRLQLACNVLYRWSDGLVCQSESVADYYRKRCKRASIFVIPNPLSEDSVGETTKKCRSRTVIAVGRLSEQKNHRLAISAFKRIRERFPELTMKIYGSGPLENELTEMIRMADLEDNVTLEGVVPNVMRQHSDAALFLFTSNYEGYPNALMEAAAAGIPTVTTDFSPGTAREIIEDGVNGYVVPVGGEDEAVEASIKALSGKLDLAEVIAASQRVRKRHRTELILESWLNVFGPLGRKRLPL
ncbi:glycosyltransferase [Nesterenkonia sp. AY15]|uniref:glycosyltransferase n=1 Tax=Nesterenkonia sp. AY15 TaxID=2901139 RepID=UPI001F4CBFFC|nr:glycosyltransferase [Nesterenkonia sp. AY15]MCH8571900.1 glycosyltransferase [Nesterenkonia sp. AY15]